MVNYAWVVIFAVFSLFPTSTIAQQVAAAAYAPTSSACSSDAVLVRSAGTTHQSLSAQEAAYIATRKSKVLPGAWASYLSNVKASAKARHITLPNYVSDILAERDHDKLPTLGIATSGGGYRAAIFGAGVMNTFDSRNKTSVLSGTGGLLQTTSYLAGLSGGAWLVGSLIQANFPRFFELIFGPETTTPTSLNAFGGWNAQISLLQPSNNASVEDAFLVSLIEEVAGKAEAGFPVTIADVWARALSRHFANGTTATNFFDLNVIHGAGLTLSGIANLPTFVEHQIPFPIILADTISKFEDKSLSVDVVGNTVPLTNPIYEFNPFESGSFDPMLSAFTPTKFLGSHNGTCVSGFDQISFIEGISSNLFNSFNVTPDSLALSSVGPIIAALNATFPQSNLELDAGLVPNPFMGMAPKTFIDSNQTLLAMVDGGEDGEVDPLQPLLVKARGVDVILAIDAPADTEENFTNGSSILATAQRVALFPSTYSFPPIPSSPNTFVSHNLVKQPTFFGCNSDTKAPLVIYIANGGAPLGQTPLTNIPTAQDAYNNSQIQGMLNQIFDIATQGIPIHPDVKDPEWPVCLICGVVDRARERAGIKRSGSCESCLQRYCWS
ncbi:hypothetical protein PHLCEN_2v7966 [Hermanssonia centrifuga]|uniref:Lysophospholipase n=1 Tax=Hermanssonia centrifuga TaxID=98765 RepID=A0A2R6NV00_9APHY|nr:hypothetical protein PHLCEN_2v7966 [Hermanssonia centrifuga]